MYTVIFAKPTSETSQAKLCSSQAKLNDYRPKGLHGTVVVACQSSDMPVHTTGP